MAHTEIKPKPAIISSTLTSGCLPHPCHRELWFSWVGFLLVADCGQSSPVVSAWLSGSSHVAKHDEIASLFSNHFSLKVSGCCLATHCGHFSLLFPSSVSFCLSLAQVSLWKKD